MKKPISLFVLLLFVSSILFSQTVKIGTQVWTSKNLDVSTFRNGDLIPEAKTDAEWKKARDNKQPAWCYYGLDAAYGIKYGKLYNWYAVIDPRGLAPAGYHIPSHAEWTILSNYLGGESVAGKKMKSNKGWFEDGNGTNSSGFAGLPGGYRLGYGTFNEVEEGCYWWSSTSESKDFAWARYLNYFDDKLESPSNHKDSGFYVRCIKN